MKKNILTIIILAFTLMNTIMIALIVFAVVPASQRTDKLISQVASVIDLELTDESAPKVDVENIEYHKIEEAKTTNLKNSGDGKEHYAKMDYVSLSINKTSEDYDRISDLLAEAKSDSAIMDIVDTTISSYTIDDALDKEKLKNELKDKLNEYFGSSDFVIGVALGNVVFQ